MTLGKWTAVAPYSVITRLDRVIQYPLVEPMVRNTANWWLLDCPIKSGNDEGVGRVDKP